MWKPIQGWEGLYSVNENGEVKNDLNNHIIVGDVNSAGYQRVSLYRKGHNPPFQRFFRHRLVAMTFIENPQPNKFIEVNHIDTNKENNSVTNLEWCTPLYNVHHSAKKDENRYKPFKVVFVDGRTRYYRFTTELAKELNISSMTIKGWLNGRIKSYPKYGIQIIEHIERPKPLFE